VYSLGNTVDASDFMGCSVVQAMRMMKFTLREGLVTALNGFVLSVHTSIEPVKWSPLARSLRP
jgi:hypothetical protein